MGTMYYAIIDPCDHCGHGERHALCKSMRTFRAYLTSDPWGLPITSWADWKTVLARPEVVVINEYGEQCPTELFIENVEKSGPLEKERVKDRTAWNWYAAQYDDSEESFLDAEGYRFDSRYFL